MGDERRQARHGLAFVVPIAGLPVAPLPDAVRAKWSKYATTAKEDKPAVARLVRHIYASSEGRRSPLRAQQRSSARLADARARAADALASAAAAAGGRLPRGSGDDTAEAAASQLAERLLANMEAATARREAAQAAKRARLAAKLPRLAQGSGSQQHRRELLADLRDRLAQADVREQQRAPAARPAVEAAPASQLARLTARHGVEDWMVGLSPSTAASAAALRVEHSSRRVQRVWRRFASQRKTTAQLARAFADTGITRVAQEDDELATEAEPAAVAEPAADEAGAAVPGMVMIGALAGGDAPLRSHASFEGFASKLQSPHTIRAAQALLRRLEQRLALRGVTNDGAASLLRQLSPSRGAAAARRPSERFPVRVMLCAYMIKQHPEVVFNSLGDVEARLSSAAASMLDAFEALLARLLQPLPSAARADGECSPAAVRAVACPSPLSRSMTSYAQRRSQPGGSSSRRSGSGGGGVARQLFPPSSDGPAPAAAPAPVRREAAGASSLASLLVGFDEAWLEYLDQFVVWKGHDAAALEHDLLLIAVRLERSMRLKLGRREPDSPEVAANPDLQAMIAQVAHDHSLLAERIARLRGPEGTARLAAALHTVRQQVAAELAAAEAAEAQAAAAAEESEAAASGPESSASESSPSRSRSVSRSVSRASSLADPVSDAEALAAAQAVARGDAAAAPGSPTPARRDAPAEGQQAGDALSNEQMVWEMVYNPEYSLPTADAEAAWHRAMGREVAEEQLDASDAEALSPEQLAGVVARRARVIAERAFWDSIVWRFKTAAQGQALPAQLAPLLSELGTELAGLLGDAAEAQRLGEEYAEPAVLSRLGSRLGQAGGGANLAALGAMLEQLAGAITSAGGPERAAEAADASQELRARMAAALAAAAAEPPAGGDASPGRRDAASAAALAEALAAALRLLMTQLKLVKLDAANARLAGLARAMRERGAVAYLRTKLAAAWQLPDDDGEDAASPRTAAVAERLPRTAAWLAAARAGGVPQLQASLASAGLALDQAAAAAAVVAGGLASVELRSGVRGSPAASPGARSPRSPAAPASPGAGAGAGAVRPLFPVSLDSWRGGVRAALLALVSGSTPAVGPELPEVLALDRARLHELQNALQQLLVAAAGLLIVQQLRQAAGLPWDAELRAAARRRLLVVMADPGMKLAHLVTELAQLAGAGGGAGVASEQRVTHMFTTIVNPEAAGFRAISTAIGTALAAHLLYGRAALAADGASAAALASLLSRVGAAPLADDVADLGQRLAGVAAVSEAVSGPWLSRLAGA